MEMTVSIEALLESLNNPEGRFKTLTGLHLDCEYGRPHYLLHGGGTIADFRVQWNGHPYVVKFFLQDYCRRAVELRQLTGHLRNLHSPYFVEYLFRPEEMLVFDAFDRPQYADVVLMELPEGELLNCFLTRRCDQEDTARLSRLRREFCRMGVWLLGDAVVHGSLKPTNIVVQPDCSIRLINYETMRVPQMGDPAGCLNDDNVTLANIAMGLKVLSSVPAAYRALSGNSLFRSPVLRSSLLSLFDELARQSGSGAMQMITGLLMQSNYTLPYRDKLMTALELLAEDDTPLTMSAEQLERVRYYAVAALDEPVAAGNVSEGKDAGAAGSRPAVVLSRYDWSARMEEALICVQKGDKWGYLHSDGTEAIALKYDWADDFLEGRAVVKIGEQFALIDKAGREILPPVYETIEWDCMHGVVCVSYEGKIGLYDRDGRELVVPTYDWMGDVRESELLLVRRDGLCGYIRHSGEVVVPLQYDDAFDFGDRGVAQVSQHGREFLIDTSGHEIT